ncbi:23S rRNA (uracil(1939)-C(5))-methyltransferase RlmD [Kineothrix sedimenti]|uniref:23S rRNA (Uracil(1939)-C(5))-methyltransferase RlmD n=1 Tax=Kineothrix sedimenti TaxID=3123317 RepID=A0ABZ3EUS2_9FIRM
MDIGKKRNEARGNGKINKGPGRKGTEGDGARAKSGNRNTNASGKGERGGDKDKDRWGEERGKRETRERGNGEGSRRSEGKVSGKGNGSVDRDKDKHRNENVNGEWKARGRSSGESLQRNEGKVSGRGNRNVDGDRDKRRNENVNGDWRARGPKGEPEKGGKFKAKNKDGQCKVSRECGGCQMIDVPYPEQLIRKHKETEKLLKPFVKLEGIIGMDEPEHYRNKVNAAFTHDRKGKPLSGVYKEGTHYIIPVEECLLENKKADEIIGSIRELLPSFKIKTYDEDTGYGLLRHVMVRVGYTSGQIMVVLVLASPIMPSKNNFVKALLKLHSDITTIVINVNDRKTSMVLGDKEQVIYGKGYIEDSLNGKSFKISPKSFYQINSVQTQKLYGKAIEYAGLTGKETILDAYCGIGTIGIMAADKAKQVIGVELNKDAVKDAVINAKQNQISNIQFYQKDAGEFMVQLAEQGTKIDTVFMDPPRAGSDEVFLNSLVALKPKKVVYVSCNPETLARDLEYLVKKGYRGVKGVAVDMFPFTNHVESVILLHRKNI